MFGYAMPRDAGPAAGADLLRHKILELLTYARKNGDGEAGKLGPDAKSQVTVRYEGGKPAGSPRSCSRPSISMRADSENVRKIVEPYIREALPAAGSRRTQSGTSTRPANSWSAAPMATPASPAARSSSTPMAARPRMAAAPSPARTRPRSTARPPMPPAISPRTWSPPASPTAHDPALLRHRRRPAAVDLCRPAWHRQGRRGQAREGAGAGDRPVAARHPRHLDLNKPIYAKTSAYGHFGRKPGRDGSFSWEKTDLTKALKDAVAA